MLKFECKMSIRFEGNNNNQSQCWNLSANVGIDGNV